MTAAERRLDPRSVSGIGYSYSVVGVWKPRKPYCSALLDGDGFGQPFRMYYLANATRKLICIHLFKIIV